MSIICTRSEAKLALTSLEGNIVRVDYHLDRIMVNVGEREATFNRLEIFAEDWGIKPPAIEDLSWRLWEWVPGLRARAEKENDETTGHGIKRSVDPEIVLPRLGWFAWHGAVVEFKPLSSGYGMAFGYDTIEHSVEVEASDGLEVEIARPGIRSFGSERRVHVQRLITGQPVNVRWWPA